MITTMMVDESKIIGGPVLDQAEGDKGEGKVEAKVPIMWKLREQFLLDGSSLR